MSFAARAEPAKDSGSPVDKQTLNLYACGMRLLPLIFETASKAETHSYPDPATATARISTRNSGSASWVTPTAVHAG